MGIFKKKKPDEFEGLHNDNLFNDDDDVIIPLGQHKGGSHAVGHNGATAPHALTVNEVLDNSADTPTDGAPMPDSIYTRMKERDAAVETGIGDDYVPSWATPAATSGSTDDILSNSGTASAESPVKKTAPEVIPVTPAPIVEPEHSASSDAFLERCRIAVEKATADEASYHTDSTKPRLTAEVVPEGLKEEEKPTTAPTTRSVDDIIRMLRGNMPDAREGKPVTPEVTPEPEEPEMPAVEPADEPVTAEAPAVEAPAPEAPASDGRREVKVEVEVIPTEGESTIMHSAPAKEPEPDSDVRIYGKIVRGAVIQHTPEGDVEASEFVRAPKVSQDTIVADDKTVMFGDLGDIISQRADADLDAGTDDFDDDDFDDDDDYLETPYYEAEDPALKDIDDYKNLNDAARLHTDLAAEKSKNKTVAIFSTVITALLTVSATGALGFLPLATVRMLDIILLLAALVMNWDIFADLKKLGKFRPSFDTCTAVASSLVLVQNILSHFVFEGKHVGFAAAAAVLLTVNRFSKLMKSSRILKGLEFIANSESKRAVVSVGGNNGKVISSGACEGEALVLCDRSTVNVKDYLKNCGYDSPFDRKVKILFTVCASLAVAAFIIVGLISGFGTGFEVMTAMLCLLWPASAALVCELPMYLASKKISGYGAMLAGYKGAYELNLANIVAVSSTDLFPEGSVKLYNMKALSENEMGNTLMNAAAVAIAANSPLSGIFKGIIGNVSPSALPKVNGVQYEDKMGISGWIGENTILIGNRNLMQGHNISVPPASVDQKILRAGYFPVYIASGGVPCLLFLVKYETDPEVAHELQLLCNTGMTVVVDPKDPNTTDAMICDYFGLPNDALKVMNHNGRVSYERTSAPTDSASAPAAFGKDVCGFFASITASIRLGGIYSILTAIFIIAAVLGVVMTVYLGVTGKASLVNPLTVAGFQILFAVISAIIAKIKTL